MKSSRSRSRSKSNRSRSPQSGGGGNVVNRVFDSSGPEGKVRGTPQQIIEKYNQLARDAQLSNDRVAAENFQQHAEHYTRMLSEAQREIDTRREEQERQNRERQAERDRERTERQEREAVSGGSGNGNGGSGGGNGQTAPGGNHSPEQRHEQKHEHKHEQKHEQKHEHKHERQGGGEQPRSGDPIAAQGHGDAHEGESNLVETPESQPKKPRAPRRKPRPKTEAAPGDGGGDTPKAAE